MSEAGDTTQPPAALVLASEFLVQVEGVHRVSGEGNPFDTYLQRLAVSSRRKMARHLSRFAHVFAGEPIDPRSFPWGALRYRHTQAVQAALREGRAWSPATANQALAALRGVLLDAFRLGLISAEDFHRARAIEDIGRGSPGRHGRVLSVSELRRLLQACEPATAAGARDLCLVVLGYLTGLRRSELASIELAKLDLAEASLDVLTKGTKFRRLGLPPLAVQACRRWLLHRGIAPGRLLLSVRRGDYVDPVGVLTGDSVAWILARVAERAGVARFSPHCLRKSLGTHLLERGADALLVRDILGHSNVQTTLSYDLRKFGAQREAVDSLAVAIEGVWSL